MYCALLILPLSTFACLAAFGRYLGARGTIVLSVASSCLCAALGMMIFYEVALCKCAVMLTAADYFNSGLFDAQWGLHYDVLTSVMVVVVTLISALVIIYSTSYMVSDPHLIRFMSYLKLFSVAMLVLVTSDNYVQLFVGWEGVGLASFLLISFWFTRLQASKAAIQAMLLNRVGDIGLALGIIILYLCYKTTHYNSLFCACTLASGELFQSQSLIADAALVSSNGGKIGFAFTEVSSQSLAGLSLHTWATLALFIGAMGKSGQFGLHVWLPNAMNAPTPVSALLHAATMVTAGVFLLARSSPLLEFAPDACLVIVIIGGLTTLFAGSIGLVQNDFKAIIAYSTCSQLGYMVTIAGLGGYDVSMFHLFNHAWFKACLFLTAGAVIHSLSNQQDIRKFGGLQQLLISCYVALLIATLALVGTPFLTGFYSKDVILEHASAHYSLSAHFASLLTCFSVLTTSYYSFRLLFMVFHSNVDQSHSKSNGSSSSSSSAWLSKLSNMQKPVLQANHPMHWVMAGVLAVLAIGSIYAGWLTKIMFIGLGSDFWNSSLSLTQAYVSVEAEFLPQSVKLMPLMLTVLGLVIAYAACNQFVLQAYANTLRRFGVAIYVVLNQRWFYDKLLNSIFGYGSYNLGLSFIKVFDKGLLELLPIFGLGLPRNLKTLYLKLGTSQSGLIYHYAIIMVIASLVALAYLSFSCQGLDTAEDWNSNPILLATKATLGENALLNHGSDLSTQNQNLTSLYYKAADGDFQLRHSRIIALIVATLVVLA